MHVQACHGKNFFFRGLQTKLRAKIAQKSSIRMKSNLKLRKRCMKRNANTKNHILKLYGINSAGIKSKMQSFENVLSQLKPHIWMVEETKLKPHEKIKGEVIDEFQVFYLSRQESHGGGLNLELTKCLSLH